MADIQITNAARNVVGRAIGALQAASDDMGMEEFDVALDHLRIARETIERAERAVRAIMAEEPAA